MGWWNLGSDTVIGDLPVDSVTLALQESINAIENEGSIKPTLKQLMTALSVALTGQEENYLEKGHPLLQGNIQHGTSALAQIPADENSKEVNPHLLEGIKSALTSISRSYNDAVERGPRIEELIACFAFVLSSKGERLLSAANLPEITVGNLLFVGELES